MHNTNLTLFDVQFNSHVIRTGELNGVIVFCLKDAILSINSRTDVTDAKKSIVDVFGDESVISLPTVDALGREQYTFFVFEAGLTFLLSRSRTKLGRELNRWIHTEVLPSIRKTLIETNIINVSSMLSVGLSKDKSAKSKFVKDIKDSIESLKANSSRYKEMESVGLSNQALALSNALVKLQDGVLITTSVVLAETFKKEHKNVIRDIGSILSESSNPEVERFLAENIKESTYVDSVGRTQKCYVLTKEGFSFVALGFTGSEANLFKVRYIKAFEEMHDNLRGYAIAHFLGRTKTKQLIYVIRNPITDLVKIGVTNNIQRRITQLECASGCELDLVFCTPNGDNSKEIEQQVHRRFADFRQRGEWFSVSTDLVIEYLTKNAVIKINSDFTNN